MLSARAKRVNLVGGGSYNYFSTGEVERTRPKRCYLLPGGTKFRRNLLLSLSTAREKKEGRRNKMGMMRREGAEFFRIFFVFPPPGSGGEMEGREALPTGSQ